MAAPLSPANSNSLSRTPNAAAADRTVPENVITRRAALRSTSANPSPSAKLETRARSSSRAPWFVRILHDDLGSGL